MDATERLRGWRDTMAEHGLVARQPLEGDLFVRSGYRIGTMLTERGTPFSALVVANDQMSLGCIHALAEQGIRVPEDVEVIGFDDIPQAAHFAPPLTTMRQDFRRLGTDTHHRARRARGQGRPVQPATYVSPRRWSSVVRPVSATPSVLAGLVRHPQGGGRCGVVAADDVSGGLVGGHPDPVAGQASVTLLP